MKLEEINENNRMDNIWNNWVINSSSTNEWFCFFNENVDYKYQKAIDNISYDRLKKVEDTARAMITTYKSDKLTYEAYKNTDEELATQAKIRANRTAVAYNEYILKNSFQWKGNIPSDIYNQLEIIE